MASKVQAKKVTTSKAAKAPAKERRKAVRKEESIRLRCTADQKALLTDAATRAGTGVSSWLLVLGIAAAQKQGG